MKKSFITFGVFVLVAASAQDVLAAPRGPVEVRQRDTRARESKQVERTPEMIAKMEALGLNPKEIETVVSQYRDDVDNLPALKALIKGMASKNAEIDSKEAVRQFIKLRAAGMGEKSDITPASLLKVLVEWQPSARANFVAVLKEAVKISESANASGKPVTNQEAFETALKKAGYFEAYKAQCK